MNFKLVINYSEGNSKEVTCAAADMVAFESHFDMSVARLEKEVRLSHLFFLAWNVEKRTKATELDFEAWLNTVESVTPAEPVKK